MQGDKEVVLTMRCISSGDNPADAACALRGKSFVKDREVLHAQANRRRRDERFELLGARRLIAVTNEGPRETPDDGKDAVPTTRRHLRHWEALKVGAPKQRAPFRPPSRGPNPLPTPPNYSCLRQRHLQYYNSIRRRFITNTSSMGGGRHSTCKKLHAASEKSERPPWDGSTQVSFAPAGFQFQYQLPGSKRIATREAGKNTAEAKAQKGTLASVDNTWSATPNTLFRGLRQQDLPHENRTPDMGTQHYASFKQRPSRAVFTSRRQGESGEDWLQPEKKKTVNCDEVNFVPQCVATLCEFVKLYGHLALHPWGSSC